MPSPAQPRGVRSVTAVVLAGGRSARFGAGDKTAATLGGTTVLDRLLAELPGSWPVLVVGADRPTTRPVQWLRERPPFGGPVAALAAALPLVQTPIIALLAGDQPFAGRCAADLAQHLGDLADLADLDDLGDACDAVVGTDETGHLQPLLAAYRTAALRLVIPAEPHGVAMRQVVSSLVVVTVAIPAIASSDVDTPADLDAARNQHSSGEPMG